MAGERVGSQGALALLPVEDADLAYVQRIRAGDTEAFVPLWAKYERGLYQFFLKQTGNRQDAEDLASETMIATLQSIPEFRGANLGSGSNVPEKNCRFKTYLMSVARHKLSHWIRRKRVRNEVRLDDVSSNPSDAMFSGTIANDAWVNGPVADPEANILASERDEIACGALANIGSSAQFKVVSLHYFVGLSHQDIATALTTPAQVVNTRLQDGRKALRRGVDGYCEASTGV